MRKYLVLIILVVLMFFIPEFTIAQAPIKVITTTEDLASIAEQIGKERVQVESLSKGYENLHFVRLKPSFIVKLRDADMLVIAGMGIDEWVFTLIQKSANKTIFRGSKGYVNASNGVKPLNMPSERVNRSMGDIHGEGNPHYHLDPVNAKYMALNITRGLKKVDPAGAAVYEANYQRFLKELAAKLTTWLKQAAPLKGKNIITYHDSWPYFANRFGLKIVNNIEPKPGIPPSAKHVSYLVDQIKQSDVDVIMVEPYFNKSIPDMIGRKTGINVITVPSSTGGVAGVNSYFELFDKLIDQLIQATQ
jgi:ABC-type Zn uptake system ZnuABC Zn-binding protein ZnuA